MVEGKREERRTAAVLRAWDFAASCLRGALPPVDLRAVCLVRAIVVVVYRLERVVRNLKGLGSTATERLIKLGVKENLELGIAIVYIYQTQSISRVAFDALCCC